MAVFPRPAAPSALWQDLRNFVRERERHHLIGLALAILMPLVIVAGFYHDATPDAPKPSIIYVQSWPDSRTDAEIERQNIADQKKLDAARAERRRQFQVLAKQLGM